MPDAAVNSQITDSVSQVNTKVLGDAPAIAMGNLFAATSQALANAAHNATNNQQQAYVVGQAAATEAIATMMSIDTTVTSLAAKKALDETGTGPAAATPPQAAATSATGALATAGAVTGPVPGPTPAIAHDLVTAAHDAVRTSSDPMLMLMVLDAGALALFDAVAHLNRVSMIAEAATAQALTRVLAEPTDDAWQQAIQAAEHSIIQATNHLDTVAKMTISLTRQARG